MEKLKFEDIPDALGRLLEKVERIEKILLVNHGKAEDAQQLMNVAEAAQFMQLSIATIYSKVSRGELAAYKPGHRLYFDKVLLTDHIRAAKKCSNQEIAQALEDGSEFGRVVKKRRAQRWSS